MENRNRKNNFQGELDNLWLKERLNASFEADDIKVSEDLMDRTLKAVRKAKNQENQKEEMKKRKRFPVRRLVSAAALVTVLLIGIGIVQTGFPGGKKGADESMNAVTEETAMDKKSTEKYDLTQSTADGSSDLDNGTSYAITEAESGESKTDQNDSAATDDKMDYAMQAADNISKAYKGEENTFGMEAIFSDIFPVTADSVTELTITKVSGKQVTSKYPVKDATKLYDILNGYPLNPVGEADNDNDWTYKISITSKENTDYTIVIGSNIQIQSKNAKEKDKSVYNTKNADDLIEMLNQYYEEIMKNTKD
ncbi:MAG: hypothetical protein ACFWTJ_06820 [Lachnoclostridium sp.]